jgi:hypothetical protein
MNPNDKAISEAPVGGWQATPEARARPLHYAFAHHALRDVALNDPLYYLAVLASPNALTFLAALLQRVAQHVAANAAPEFTVDDLTIHTGQVAGFPCAIVELPTPRASPEAFFTAAVLLVPFGGNPGPEPPVRYFTLEQSFELDGTPFAMMCEWTKTIHSNFGGGPPPRLADFTRTIEHLIGSSKA